MTRFLTIGCICLQLLLSAQTPLALARYTNARYSYTVEYPKELLRAESESDNGDGQRFASPDGRVTLVVWGQQNVMGHGVEAQFAQDLESLVQDRRLQVTYKVVRPDWFVLSGHAGTQIVYQKTFLRGGLFKTMRLEYPTADKAALDPVVRQIVAGFRGN